MLSQVIKEQPNSIQGLPDVNNIENTKDAAQVHDQGNNKVVLDYEKKRLALNNFSAVNFPSSASKLLSTLRPSLPIAVAEEESSSLNPEEMVVSLGAHVPRPLLAPKFPKQPSNEEPCIPPDEVKASPKPVENQLPNDGEEEVQRTTDTRSGSCQVYEPTVDEIVSTSSDEHVGDPTKDLMELTKEAIKGDLSIEQKEALLCVESFEDSSAGLSSIEEQNNEPTSVPSASGQMYEPMADEPVVAESAEKQNSDSKKENLPEENEALACVAEDQPVNEQPVLVERNSKAIEVVQKPSSVVFIDAQAKEQQNPNSSTSDGQCLFSISDSSIDDALFREGTPEGSSDKEIDEAPAQRQNPNSRVTKPDSPIAGAIGTSASPMKVLDNYNPPPPQELFERYPASVNEGTKKKCKIKKKRNWFEEESLPSYMSSFRSSCEPPTVATTDNFHLACIERQYGASSLAVCVSASTSQFYRELPQGSLAVFIEPPSCFQEHRRRVTIGT